jgi:hypothetical protein
MKTPAILLSFAAATLLAAQENKSTEAKPADPKVPTHSPEQSKLNELKEDARNNETFKKAAAKIQKGAQDNSAVKKEVERAAKSKLVPSADEGKAKLEDLKKKLDKKDLKEIENMVKDGAKEGIKALRDRNKKDETQDTPPESPVTEADTPPGSFDNNSKKEETLPVRKPPVFQVAPLTADMMISGMGKDPKNPSVDLPKSDPRTRTFVLTGNARLRRPDVVVDADEVELLLKERRVAGKKNGAPAPTADPVKPGAGAKKDAPIESLVARGRVRFMIVNKDGHVQAGRCGTLIYEEKTGLFILKDWPEAEAEGYLIRGPKKDSVIRLSRTEQADAAGCTLLPLDRDLSAADLPKDAETPVPPARPLRAGSTPPASAPAPAPR